MAKTNGTVDAVKEYLTDLVVPHHRCNVNIIPDHITMLHGTKAKKQLSRKRRAHKSNTLTRKQYAELGLNTLPRKQLRYEQMLPLHKLWRGYIREHLELEEGDEVPQVHEKRYDEFSKQLVKMDFHGAKMRVLQSKCQTLVGLNGICVMDTKNVLKLLGEDHVVRTVPKSECVFGLNVGNMEFTIFGHHLTMRPAERSVKKIKNYVEPFM
ncbi:LOW QUALITY PROTEIN: ribonuclease P protein subunit p29 [Drosophila sulfurigaster albostrigata]|uniref:LOW QUALITY PROTEIN: ribonuclease P protein subunit p29 n=1 Tax=Drosophila sulfurigaster albostrigata TaxID=89887 RepID=UPI002D21CB52|nr:LOW QUALITY PROTEIN: ribonuclease P protein subunit p29 [Drosophila sulfurigaster albostrigata]